MFNCTWFRPDACCTNEELHDLIDYQPGFDTSSPECRSRLQYLQCYVCSPGQNVFYNRGSYILRVCESLCDEIYAECADATFRGVKVRDRYSSGADWCRSRRFGVSTTDCYARDPDHTFPMPYVSAASRSAPSRLLAALAMTAMGVLLRAGPSGGRGRFSVSMTGSKSRVVSGWALAIVVLLAVSTPQYAKGQFTADQVQDFAQGVGVALGRVDDVALRSADAQRLYDSTPFSTVEMNGTARVDGIRNALASFFAKKEAALNRLVAAAQSAWAAGAAQEAMEWLDAGTTAYLM